jgi:hypothetical protein
MFGFGAQAPAVKKATLDDVMTRHKANMAAERTPPTRSDVPTFPIVRKKIRFGKRHG